MISPLPPLATAVAAADKSIMSTTDLPATASARTSPLLPVLTAAIFLSAALLFAVQPMFTKMVLPRLGGAPQVWSVAMVFFQAALLAGYAYAHLITRYAPGRKSLFIQLAVMIAACFMLPLPIDTANRPSHPRSARRSGCLACSRCRS